MMRFSKRHTDERLLKSYNDNDVMFIMDAESLSSKWGFGDGDMLSDAVPLDSDMWYGNEGYDVEHDILFALARLCWPSADLIRIESCHNPVRCDDIGGLEDVSVSAAMLRQAVAKVVGPLAQDASSLLAEGQAKPA